MSSPVKVEEGNMSESLQQQQQQPCIATRQESDEQQQRQEEEPQPTSPLHESSWSDSDLQPASSSFHHEDHPNPSPWRRLRRRNSREPPLWTRSSSFSVGSQDSQEQPSSSDGKSQTLILFAKDQMLLSPNDVEERNAMTPDMDEPKRDDSARQPAVPTTDLWMTLYCLALCGIWGHGLRTLLARFLPTVVLFVDLPANALGCFSLGYVTEWTRSQSHQQEPQQSYETNDKDDNDSTDNAKKQPQSTPLSSSLQLALWTGISTGFCGCLTTFSSWNTQMIQYLYEEQITQACAGYALGTAVALQTFQWGQWTCRILGAMLSNPETRRHGQDLVGEDTDDSSSDEEEEEEHDPERGVIKGDRQQSTTQSNPPWYSNPSCWIWLLSMTTLLLLVGLVIGAVLLDGSASWYQEMVWEVGLFVPLGTWLRWSLAQCGNATTMEEKGKLDDDDMTWKRRFQNRLPYRGTLVANLVACALSVLLRALSQQQDETSMSSLSSWTHQLRPALETGFCASLSTVSTWTKEVVLWKSTPHVPDGPLVYAATTLTLAMAVGLALYVPLVA